MVNFEGDFCGGPFWNYSLVWQSKQPDFTLCFQKTVLSWIPLAVITILHIFEVPGYFSNTNKNRHILLNYYNVTKLILTLSLIGINIMNRVAAPKLRAEQKIFREGDLLHGGVSPTDRLDEGSQANRVELAVRKAVRLHLRARQSFSKRSDVRIVLDQVGAGSDD